MRVRPGKVAALLVGIGLAGAASARAQTLADLFDVTTLQEIRLSVNSRDLKLLHQDYQLNTHYTADFQWRGVKVRNVAIRSRGSGSRNPIKVGLLVEFNRYTTGQRFLGLSAIVLRNGWQDPSLMHNKLAFWMFEQMGLTAPRESFCRLFINNEYQGVYTITEQVDGNYVTRVTGETDGTLFEFHWGADRIFHAEDRGGIDAYKPMFEARTHVLDADTTLYSPIVNLFHEVNGPDDAVWRSRVEQYIDLNEFVTHAAVEMFVAENDGILGYAGMNNFYLYRFQGTTRQRLFVWDKDNAFIGLDTPIRITDDNVLFARAMTYPDLRETYLQALEQCARLTAGDGGMASQIDQIMSVMADAARADTKKQFTNDEFDAGVQLLRDFAARRPQQVLDAATRIRLTGS